MFCDVLTATKRGLPTEQIGPCEISHANSSLPVPSSAVPSPVPFSAGIVLRSSDWGLLAIRNSSHLCIQDSKDCNERVQHINGHGGSSPQGNRVLSSGLDREGGEHHPLLWVGAAQAWLKPGFVYPDKCPFPKHSWTGGRWDRMTVTSTDLPVHMIHGAFQVLQVVHQVVVQLRELPAGVSLL